MKKKVVVFTRTLLIGGAEKQSMLLTKALQDRYETWGVVLHGNLVSERYIEYIKENNLHFLLLKGPLYKKILILIRFLKHNKIDIIFSYLTSTNFWAAFLGRLYKIPFIVGGIRSSRLPYRKFLLLRFIHNYVNFSTIINNYTGAEYFTVKGFNANKIVVIPNCIEANSDQFLKVPGKELCILSVGRFVQEKDYLTSLKAILYLVKTLEISNIHYYIVGYGPLKEQLVTEVDILGLNTKVTICENPENIVSFWRQADIYLSTSLFEGLSNSIMEAMSYKLPIVATNVGDNKYLIKEEINGYLLPVGDYEQISEKLKILVDSEEMRKQYGHASYEIIKYNFSFEVFQCRYIEFIDSLKQNE